MAEAERKGQNEDGVRAAQIVYCVNSASTLRRFVSVQTRTFAKAQLWG